MTGSRIVFVMNEGRDAPHVDVRAAIVSLKQSGHIADFAIIPHVAMLQNGRTGREVGEAVLEAGRAIGAGAVVWFHTGRMSIPSDIMESIHRDAPLTLMLEGDWYQWPFKPFPRQAARIVAGCDMAFAPGVGGFSRLLRTKGAGHIGYVPLTTDGRFVGEDGPGTTAKDFDVVLIGNNVASALPFRTMPGARWRHEIVRALAARHGDRFAVFGHGWSGPNAMGPLPFDRQGEVLSRSEVCVGVNNLHADCYFSNRLPIAMSWGTPCIHNEEHGVRRVIPDRLGIGWYKTTSDMLETVSDFLEGRGRYDKAAARRFACLELSMERALRYVVECVRELAEGRDAPTNPWLGPGSGGEDA